MTEQDTADPFAPNPSPFAPATGSTLEIQTDIPGSKLVPDFDKHKAGILVQYWYWIGILPSTPVEGVTLCGENFPKLEELIIKNTARNGKTQRIPCIGALVMLNERKIRLMREKLPRTIVRFTDPESQDGQGVKEEPGTGQNLGDLHVRPRRGQLITIPTKESVLAANAAGKATRQYVAAKDDEPAARFMFAHLCPDQKTPQRGTVYPGVLEETGLQWPHVIED